jgi:segregation and condensation protein A
MQQFLSESEDPGLAVTLFDLVKTFQTVLDRAKNRPTYAVDREDVTVPDMIRYLRETLRNTPRSQPLSVTELFERQRSKRALLCLFLAILELVKRQAIQLGQKAAFGDIYIKRSAGFEEMLGSDDAIAAAEKEYS